MATKLDKTIKREIEIDGTAYTVAVSPEGVKLTQKGFRKGQEMSWTQLLAGSASAGGGGNDGGTGGGTRAAMPAGATPGATEASRSGWRPADTARAGDESGTGSRGDAGSSSS